MVFPGFLLIGPSRAGGPLSLPGQGVWAMVSAAATLGSSSCTLDITAPLEPPPVTWDSGLNTHPASAGFRALLDGYAGDGLPGVVLFVRTPRGVWNGAAGYAKIETGEPMLPTHRQHAASITKMYTAAAVLLLAEEGVIDLDTRIGAYLPEDVWRPIPNGSEATVRQLLGHRSGIPDFSGDLTYDLDFLNDPRGPYPPRRILSYLHGQNAIFPPGTGYFYSNANYFLLAMVMDQVTNGSHADVISSRILQPLGLTATYYRNESGYPTPPGLVNSYQDFAGNGQIMNVTDLATHACETFFGHAGLMATSADFAAFLDAPLEGEIVGLETLAEMQDWPPNSRYGLGLSYRETAWGISIGHSGGDVGVLGEVRHFPDQDATVVLLSNGGDGGVPERLFFELWEDALELAMG